MSHPFFSFAPPFVSFSPSHFWTLTAFVALLGLVVKFGRELNDHQNLLLGRVIALFLSFTVVVFSFIHSANGLFNIEVDLPLSICNLFAFIAPLLFWNPNRRRLEVIYFLVMSGTFQAMLTPDLYADFPSYGFFKYWIVHGGLVILVLHHVLSFNLLPEPRGMLRAFVWLNVYLLSLVLINLWLNANYFYMMEKPLNPSILDYFGPWPIYIFTAEVLALAFFAVAYVPIFVAKKYFLNPATINQHP
ncbi:TIGR02206 family membrane protein [Porticoccaceae bacterium]|nr:TIGR02206 family membrane protein [Porticoccaceae bacterium]